jgi:hypothetical protein
MTFGKPFEPGRQKTGGRAKGVRNKISEAFLKDLHAEWERSGAATLKILAVENPAALAHLVAKVLPTAFDDDHPAVVRIITGVPRAGEIYEPKAPQIPTAAPLPSLPAHEGDDAE